MTVIRSGRIQHRRVFRQHGHIGTGQAGICVGHNPITVGGQLPAVGGGICPRLSFEEGGKKSGVPVTFPATITR